MNNEIFHALSNESLSHGWLAAAFKLDSGAVYEIRLYGGRDCPEDSGRIWNSKFLLDFLFKFGFCC